MDKNQQMSSALSLQNLSGMKRILSGLSTQQQARIDDSQQDELRQQQACFKQMSFTKGIEGIVTEKLIKFRSSRFNCAGNPVTRWSVSPLCLICSSS